MHLAPLIQDLAIILVVAAAMTLVFRAIRQPVVLGYLVAGFLVGPHFKWFPNVVDSGSVAVWAEIGVIFLLFSLGLEFSFKKLARVGGPASITAVVEVAGMVAIGLLIGYGFGWRAMDSLYLGGILGISSTTIIIRAFDEMGMKARGFAKLVFGVLIVEDLVAILLLVMISTVTVSRTFSGLEMGMAVLKLAFFLILWFVLGIFLIPSFLKRVRTHMRQETLLVVSVGLCFLMVVLATRVGFSPALGAFVIGSILAETMEGERIEHMILPLKDLFGAVFFVSVGMLIDPEMLVQHALPILVITAATVLGKLITTTIGALISGQSLRHSVQAGMSLAQIGEFSFIIASLGVSLKVTSDFLYPIAVSVSAVTTFTTPYLIQSADKVVLVLESHLPQSWLRSLERFRIASTSVTRTDDWKNFLKMSVPIIAANCVIVVALFLLVSEFVNPWLETQLGSRIAPPLSLMVAFIVSAPFLWAMAFRRVGGKSARTLWNARRFAAPLFMFEMARWITAVTVCGLLSIRIVSAGTVLGTIALVVIFSLLFLSRHLKSVYQWLERRFIFNLNEKDEATKSTALPALAPWDSHLIEIQVSPESPLIGNKLSDLMIRERFGVTIALIKRGRIVIPAPGRDDMLYPDDKLQVIGSDEQITRFKKECDASDIDRGTGAMDYVLKYILVSKDNLFANQSIRNCGLREATQGLVVGIEKQGKRILNPDSSTIIEPGDGLWIVGNRHLMTNL